MNTSFRFLIPTIFIALGFIISCNDDITSSGEEEPGVNKNTNVETPSVPDPPSIASNSTPSQTPSTTTNTDTNSNPNNSENPDDENNNFNLDEIDPEDLSRQIKDAEYKIEKLKEENIKHYDELSRMVELQKEIAEEIKRRKIIMRSLPLGTKEQEKAKKDFEDEKKFGKEKLKILKDKNIFLHKLSRTISDAMNEKEILQKKQEFFFRKQKEKENKNSTN
ncbi:hypothetical protein [Blattabacterium cuenoti]|uniref:hypothetical protein n=1 Tax=Blattabacterium cuenoti TaxID=1653831 RepID=UPI00163C2B04|nr:hypothetical protein [Blattabacterium cuenoti]